MDRTEELQRLAAGAGGPEGGEESEGELVGVLRCSGEVKVSLDQLDRELETARLGEIERLVPEIKKAIEKGLKIVELLGEMEEEDDASEFTEGVRDALLHQIKGIEIRLEIRKHKTRRKYVDIALEPEKPEDIKPQRVQGDMMQILQEENESILENRQSLSEELVVVRKKISEIDKLQKFIRHEIFSQDERVDQILHKTNSSTVDVKISKNYLKRGKKGRKSIRRLLSLLILILSLVILILHVSNK
jgi:hypothetical protein